MHAPTKLPLKRTTQSSRNKLRFVIHDIYWCWLALQWMQSEKSSAFFFFCFFVKDNLRWSSKNRSTLVNKHSILWYFACNGRTLNWEFEIIWFNINEIFFLRYAYEFLMKMSRRFPSKTFRVCNVHVCCMGAWMFVILFKQHPLCNPMFPSWCWPVAIDTCGACAIQRCILDTGAKLTLYLNITYRSAAVYTCYVCTVCMMMGSTRLRSFYGS